MNYKEIVIKILQELPQQVEILKKEYLKLSDKMEVIEKMNDLNAYEKRMREGLLFLNKIEDKKIIGTIDKIRKPTTNLLNINKQRYLSALNSHRKKNGIQIDKSEFTELLLKLKNSPLIHTTKNPNSVLKRGIKPASSLWLSNIKSCANAMDIILGLDRFVFLTHGFSLPNFSDSFVEISSELINKKTTIVSSLDLFTFVLIKTQKKAPCAVDTQEWIDSLEDYSKNIFKGTDFLEIKAEYILTFFESTEKYNKFAKNNFYENFVSMSPDNEYPFLGEVKILGEISTSNIALLDP